MSKKVHAEPTRLLHCQVLCSHTLTMKTTWKEVSMKRSLSMDITDRFCLHRLRLCRPRKSSSILSSVELSDDCPHKFVLDSRLAELEVGSDYWTEKTEANKLCRILHKKGQVYLRNILRKVSGNPRWLPTVAGYSSFP